MLRQIKPGQIELNQALWKQASLKHVKSSPKKEVIQQIIRNKTRKLNQKQTNQTQLIEHM